MSVCALLLYIAVEVAAFVGLVHAVGFLWTAMIVVAVWGCGLWLVRIRGRRVIAELRDPIVGSHAASGAIADGVMVAAGSLLILLPGVVTSVFGVLLMTGWTRSILCAVARPILIRPLARAITARLRVADVIFVRHTDTDRDAGEVIEGEVVEQGYTDNGDPGDNRHRPGYALGGQRSAD